MDAAAPLPSVRLVDAGLSSPFAPGRETALARVAGDALASLGIRDGDRVVLVRRDRCEHGDVAVVLDEDGSAALWKVAPEGDRLRLSLGRPGSSRLSGANPRVDGVVVAVLRKFR